MQAPNLDKFTSDSSSVTLEWHYNEDDEAHPAFITGYLVTAQDVQQDTLAGRTKAGYCRVLVGSSNSGVVLE